MVDKKTEYIEDAENDKKYYAEHPDECDEDDLASIDEAIEDWKEDIGYMIEDWKPEKEPNMDEELENIKKWIAEKEKISE